MSVSVADHIRWMGQMHQGARYGATAGDSFHQGTYDYSTSRPYPNGLPTDPRTPGETQWWRDKMERLQRELQGYREADEWVRMGESGVAFTSDDVAGLVELTKGIFDEQ